MDAAGNVTFAWFSPDYGIHVREWPHGDGLEPVRTLSTEDLRRSGTPCNWPPVPPETSCSASSTGAA